MAQYGNHKLKVGKPKAGKVSAKCSCGGWLGTGKDAKEVQDKWEKGHINKFGNLR